MDGLMVNAKNERRALTDVGTNSISVLMVTRRARAIETIHTMTEICAIGKGMSKTGKLNSYGVKKAYEFATRIRIACREFGIRKHDVIATAAPREAKDGKHFTKIFGKTVGLPRGREVIILPGQMEAKISANGVMSSFSNITGLCIDLGGGSTEITWVVNGRIKKRASIPLGTLTMKNIGEFHKALLAIPWLKEVPKGIPFYLVGGSFRAIGRIRMQWIKYPLDIVHGFKMAGKEMTRHLRDMGGLKGPDYQKMDISKKRAATLPKARQNFERVDPVFSSLIPHFFQIRFARGLVLRAFIRAGAPQIAPALCLHALFRRAHLDAGGAAAGKLAGVVAENEKRFTAGSGALAVLSERLRDAGFLAPPRRQRLQRHYGL